MHSCLVGDTFNPGCQCPRVECTINHECRVSQEGEKNICINACSSQANSGQNTVCQAKNNGPICQCIEGCYRDSNGDFRNILACDTDSNCPTSETRQKVICNVPCNRGGNYGKKEHCEMRCSVSICLAHSECPVLQR